MAGPQGEFAEVVEDQAAGGADPAVVGVAADHGLLGAECASDLPVVLDENGRDREGLLQLW